MNFAISLYAAFTLGILATVVVILIRLRNEKD